MSVYRQMASEASTRAPWDPGTPTSPAAIRGGRAEILVTFPSGECFSYIGSPDHPLSIMRPLIVAKVHSLFHYSLIYFSVNGVVTPDHMAISSIPGGVVMALVAGAGTIRVDTPDGQVLMYQHPHARVSHVITRAYDLLHLPQRPSLVLHGDELLQEWMTVEWLLGKTVRLIHQDDDEDPPVQA